MPHVSIDRSSDTPAGNIKNLEDDPAVDWHLVLDRRLVARGVRANPQTVPDKKSVRPVPLRFRLSEDRIFGCSKSKILPFSQFPQVCTLSNLAAPRGQSAIQSNTSTSAPTSISPNDLGIRF